MLIINFSSKVNLRLFEPLKVAQNALFGTPCSLKYFQHLRLLLMLLFFLKITDRLNLFSVIVSAVDY